MEKNKQGIKSTKKGNKKRVFTRGLNFMANTVYSYDSV